MADEVDRRLNAALDEAIDEYFEDTYNNIVENRTKKQKNVHMSNETAKRAITVYGMTTSVKIRHFRLIYSDGVSA